MLRFPNAKINLGLNIVNRRENGYHDIETVFFPVPLRDVLEIVPAKDGCETQLFTYGNPVNCPPEKNLVMKAYRLLDSEFSLPAVEIHLYKHIPDGAGMGGGSSDASFALQMLNEMFSLGLSREQLAERAVKLGADCAFFIYNTPMLATGIGEILTPIEVNLRGKTLLLVKPEVSVPTAAAYAGVTPKPALEDIAESMLLPLSQWQKHVKNDFEPSVMAQYPVLEEIKVKIMQGGAVYAAMSGSGSTIFGIFESDIVAEKVAAQFADSKVFVLPL